MFPQTHTAVGDELPLSPQAGHREDSVPGHAVTSQPYVPLACSFSLYVLLALLPTDRSVEGRT